MNGSFHKCPKGGCLLIECVAELVTCQMSLEFAREHGLNL